ncbi:MAG: hypothetical protein IT550_01975 [Novosphingobium sp.]|jgi:hypothetical protein|nr:hypothetical protein [Novosphingobium sp.]
MNRRHLAVGLAASLAAATALIASTPALARPGDWDGPNWDGSNRDGRNWGGSDWNRRAPASRTAPDRSREGRIDVSRFVAEGDAARALGHGPVAVTSQSDGQNFVGPSERAPYEAAIVDQLVKAGYDTAHADPAGGQTVELRLVRSVAQPGEAPHKPVSGTAAMEVGTRGTAYGLAVNVDLSKPLPPLLSTRLEARIRDHASGTVLWEGRADIATREGDARWGEQAIAARLAEALFDGFPRASDGIAAPARDGG